MLPMQKSAKCNLVEIRIPKKFSVCIFILISFQPYQEYSGNFKFDPLPNKIRGPEESTFRGYVSICSLRPRKSQK